MLNKIVLTLLIAITLTFSLLYAYNTVEKITVEKTNTEKVLNYYQESSHKKVVDKKSEEDYLGILHIPSINLTRGFYKQTSSLNNVNKNIYYVKESIPLEYSSSMLILAAHRGNSKVSFFNDLDKLNLGSTIYLDYKGKRYTYILSNKYDELKDGYLNIIRKKNKDSLVLITCNKSKKKYQTIYVSYRKEDIIW